jgi:hypothetical protein
MRESVASALRLAGLLTLAISPGCTCTDLPAPAPGSAAVAVPAIPAGPYADHFDRATLGPDWKATIEGAYRIDNGELVVRNGHNHPLWLNRPIPRDARIEFDATSQDEAGDIKVEAWGDGQSFATDLVGQYTSTAYNIIFGGWHNQLSAITRLHEHSDDRKVRADLKVEKGRRYHFAISRKGKRVEWQIDGKPFLEFDDAEPLEGGTHSYFAFTDWEAELHFDNLTITPL